MNYLLDTHTLIWFLEGDNSLSKNSQKSIEDPTSNKYVSIVSRWEMAIKLSRSKVILKTTFENFISIFENFISILTATEIEILPIKPAHTILVSQMDFFHKDPFDRLIIAQSVEENLTTIGKDQNFPLYSIKLHW